WSSDVCSSDLQLQVIPPPEELPEEGEALQSQVVSAGLPRGPGRLEERLGEPRVVVGEPLLKPAPGGGAARLVAGRQALAQGPEELPGQGSLRVAAPGQVGEADKRVGLAPGRGQAGEV